MKKIKYKDNQITDDILKKVIEYKFPTPYEKNCMYTVFASDLETTNLEIQLFCEPYAVAVYYLYRLYECFNGILTGESQLERENIHVFDRENNNPVMNNINYVIENSKGKAKIFTNKHYNKINSAYKYQFVGHNVFWI